MASDVGPTRREYVKYGGALVTGGLLAGCTGATDSSATETTQPPTEETTSESQATTETTDSYEACIEPAGCLTFDSVPETSAVYNGGWADMAVALGQLDGFLTAGNVIPAFFFEPFDLDVPSQDELPSMWSEGGWDKKSFYELDPDVFLIDPNYLHGTGRDSNWSEADTEEIAENVAPFFGNNMRRRREFHDYELYSLYEGFERLADLFRERERYEAFAALHEEVQSEIASRLPPADERPTVGLINGGSDSAAAEFFPLDTQGEGYEMKPYRDLGVESAFPDSMEGGKIDCEQLLEVDPEIVVVHWGIATTGDTDSFSAAAFREQGPIVNLLQTEMVAQQLYPQEFGEFDPGAFPEVPEENQLFDRQRVRDSIAGDL